MTTATKQRPPVWRQHCVYPHLRGDRCAGCQNRGGERRRTARPRRPAAVEVVHTTPELRITADHDVHPYLIQLHRGSRLLAYAIRDGYGWAVNAWVGRRVRTVARAGQLWAVEAALLIHARGGAR
jgi:hypothetical protein